MDLSPVPPTPTPLRCAGLFLVLLVATACGSDGDTGTATSNAPGLTSQPASICAYLKQTDVLKRAVDLGDDASAGKIRDVKTDLQRVANVAPTYLQFSVGKILDQVGTDNTAQVAPLARLIAGTCRARNLDIPATR